MTRICACNQMSPAKDWGQVSKPQHINCFVKVLDSKSLVKSGHIGVTCTCDTHYMAWANMKPNMHKKTCPLRFRQTYNKSKIMLMPCDMHMCRLKYDLYRHWTSSSRSIHAKGVQVHLCSSTICCFIHHAAAEAQQTERNRGHDTSERGANGCIGPSLKNFNAKCDQIP